MPKQSQPAASGTSLSSASSAVPAASTRPPSDPQPAPARRLPGLKPQGVYKSGDENLSLGLTARAAGFDAGADAVLQNLTDRLRRQFEALDGECRYSIKAVGLKLSSKGTSWSAFRDWDADQAELLGKAIHSKLKQLAQQCPKAFNPKANQCQAFDPLMRSLQIERVAASLHLMGRQEQLLCS